MRNAQSYEVEALKTRINALEAGRDALLEENTSLMQDLKKYRRAGEFYLRMQKLIMHDRNIFDAWNEFYTIMALAAPDIRELNQE